jgi:hypothetical protein
MRNKIILCVLVALLGFGGLGYARDLTDTSAGGSDFPGTLDSWTNEQDTDDVNHWNIINGLGNSIIAIETELGTDPAGTDTDVKTFLQSEHEATGLHSGVAFINATTLQIGGTAVTATAAEMNTVCDGVLTSSFTYNPGSLADGAGETKVVTVTGAALGDLVLVGVGVDIVDMTVTGYVQAANTVEVRLQNESAAGPIDLASSTWKVMVFPAP